jgi:hypothetical protein
VTRISGGGRWMITPPNASRVDVAGEHYEGGHWLGSFAVYLTTRRGIR